VVVPRFRDLPSVFPSPLLRALVVVAVWLLMCSRTAHADPLDTSIRQMGDGSYKVRLAAALAISKSHDPRAVIALADALN